ncbi:MAG TPA: YdeI/OmpD-associated family protein [Ignavibacteria bacterium]|nr:YdeI/OmpD-associated family protein [Ignavibacteria bacterium]
MTTNYFYMPHIEPSNIKFFKTTDALRKWMEKNHSKKDELWMGYYKKASGKGGLTYKPALDVMLCFGWIDGISKSIDEEKYCQRYTPRRKGSIWSAVNIKKIAELTKAGLMHEAGLAAFNNRDGARAGLYSHEQAEIKFTPALLKMLKANKKAWENFSKMPQGYRKTSTWWVISAKQEETRRRRMNTLITDSEAGRRIALLTPAKRKA